MTTEKNTKRSFANILTRIIICTIILAFGIIAMKLLAKMKKPPAEVKFEEKALRVKTMMVEFKDIPVSITGYGEVKSLDVVTISPEISGKIVKIHPELETGEIIKKSEILFEIDTRNYNASVKEARAAVEQWKNTIELLDKQYKIDLNRLKTLTRNRDLAKDEFGRVRRLFEKNRVGTQSGVDSAEQVYNSAIDRADQVEQAVVLYPIKVKEAKNSLISSKARLEIAQANLNRCTVKSPFDGRIKMSSLEKGQYVKPGDKVVTLANDSVLEIQVPLDSRDVRQWMRFKNEKSEKNISWFNKLIPVKCRIKWTEDPEDHQWIGDLNRVVKFDHRTRTITVAIQIKAINALSDDTDKLPMVDGMFCSVEIPGRPMKNVVTLPRWAVSHENTVFTCLQNRLKTVPVKVIRSDGEQSFVSQGLKKGDIVITTRLIDPLENSLLESTN